MLSEDNLYKTSYMQNPFELLTGVNLNRLEEHCKRTIHFERGRLREEHEIVLELLYKYKQLETDKQNLINRLEETIDFVIADVIQPKIQVLQELLEAKDEKTH